MFYPIPNLVYNGKTMTFHDPVTEPPRLDKWLWAARFFKTRALARAAIEGGKVQVNGERAKPSRLVQAGQTLAITTPGDDYEVVVLTLSQQRGPASVAQGLYRETEASRERRSRLKAERQDAGDVASRRPDKKQRRQILQFLDRQ